MKTAANTKIFREWLSSIKDERTRAIVTQRIERLKRGLGDVKCVGGKLMELRIDVGAGWRVYYVDVDNTLIMLLAGGTKRTQRSDIANAKQLLNDLELALAAREKKR